MASKNAKVTASNNMYGGGGKTHNQNIGKALQVKPAAKRADKAYPSHHKKTY